MKPGLDAGVQRTVTFTVEPSMRPIFDDVAVHDVCSTWTLAHYFELAGRRVLIDFLEPHEEGVGSHVSVNHVGPAKVGRVVQVVATVTQSSADRLVCDNVATVDDRVIATGLTEQRMFVREVLERLLSRG